MKVGILDSGLGGLSVLAAVRGIMPATDLLYVADQARAPYGDRPPTEVLGYTRELALLLLDRGATTIVLASNTISGAALHRLRQDHPGGRFVGMDPAVKPAVPLSRSGIIAVLATTGTIEGPLLADMIERYASGATVIGVPLPGLVELIEDGLGDTRHAEDFLRDRLGGVLGAGADVFVLACTHYSFARGAIERVVAGAVIIDPAEAVARQVARVHEPVGNGRTVALTSGDPVRFRNQLAEVMPGLSFDAIEGIEE